MDGRTAPPAPSVETHLRRRYTFLLSADIQEDCGTSLHPGWRSQPLSPQLWRPSDNIWHWWTNITSSEHVPRSAVRSLALLVTWEIWRERNARVFKNHETSALGLLAKIKSEVTAWVAAGAKALESLILHV